MKKTVTKLENVSKQIPEEFICPITQDIMDDPVIDKDGTSYEKSAIVDWIKSKNGIAYSPMNGSRQIYENELIPNRGLKTQIEQFKQSYPICHIGFQNVTQSDVKNDLNCAFKLSQFENDLLLNVKVLSNTKRLPVNIVAIVDTSGSMVTGVSVTNSLGVTEDNGLSRLDIVKHALNTIVNTLNKNDYLTIITFSNMGKMLVDKKNMTTENKKIVTEKIQQLKPDGGTNLWDGIKCGIDMIAQTQQCGHVNALFVLTDGQPTVEPPRGHITMIENKLKTLGKKCIINTFGFGYDLDSSLLTSIATSGNGFYSFIPDAGFVGTVFINSLSNLFLSCMTHGSITVNFTNGEIQKVQFDTVKYELDRNILVNVGKNIISNVVVTYVDPITLELIETVFGVDDISQIINHETNQEILMNTLVRRKFIKLLEYALENSLENSVQIKLKEFINELELIRNKTPLMIGILKDAKGQVTESLSNPLFFNKWGKHYLRSLIMAHDQQNCNNFKDPGVQCYSTLEFDSLRNEIDEIFCNLQPPVPSRRPAHSTFGANTNNFNAVTSMSSYNTVDNGCFGGECVVLTLNGPKLVKDVLVGDYVETGETNSFARVRNVIKIKIKKSVNMVKFKSGLIITEWHPVHIDIPTQYRLSLGGNKCVFKPVKKGVVTWQFPFVASLLSPNVATSGNDCKKIIYNGPYMYDFILDDTHTIKINGITCVTLGHDFKENVVAHDYFGSPNVVKDIDKISVNGYATIDQKYFVRDILTNQINGIIKPKTPKRKFENQSDENYSKLKKMTST